MKYSWILLLTIVALCLPGLWLDAQEIKTNETTQTPQLNLEEQQLQAFVESFVRRAARIEREGSLAEWSAYITGKKEDYDKKAEMTNQLDMLYADKDDYASLLRLRDSGKIHDADIKRQLIILLNEYGARQIKPELLKLLSEKDAEVQRVFNTYRGLIDGKEVIEGDIYDILITSKDRELRKKAWEAQKGAGKKVQPLLLELIKLRNEAAKSLGFDNYYVMAIQFDDQNVAELTAIFDKLYEATEAAFSKNKVQMDHILAQRYGIKESELRPWDYPNPFFQDTPGIFVAADLDKYFKGKNLEHITATFYESAGLPIKQVLAQSDLYPKAGKSEHAFCFNIDRGNDIRVLANLHDDEDSCATLLHELGHAVYDQYMDNKMNWLFRQPAHIFTTEASAMMFGRLTKNPGWLIHMVAVPKEEAEAMRAALQQSLALQQLVFCRWTEVMFHFEQELYKNPEQDLNKLWWDMVEKYQKLTRPENRNEPDWASKTHFATAPVYYHNYMLGELMASQVMHYLGCKIMGDSKNWAALDFVNKPETGKWLRDNIYSPGTKYRWSDLLLKATGESLNPQYFAEQFIEGAEKK
jgi:peptidyl-dipeptidase A